MLPPVQAAIPAAHSPVLAVDARPVRALTPARAKPRARWYTVRPGDTLTSIARAELGHGGRWPALWLANRNLVRNPDRIRPKMRLRLPVPAKAKPDAHTIAAAYHAIPAIIVHHATLPHGFADPVGTFTQNTAAAVAQSEAPAPAPQPAPAPPPAPAPVAYAGTAPGGSFGACVRARESGGNPQVMNASGHYGLYQFSASTWAAYGGNPGDFGNASTAEQDQVFANAIAQGGQSNWAPYDGC
jgi:hypothetical protein